MTPPPRDPARKADVSVVTPYAKTMLAASKRAECAAKGEKAKDSQFKFHWISLKRTINIRFLVYFGNPEKHIYIYGLVSRCRESSPEESRAKNGKQDTKTKDTKPSKTKTKKTTKTKKQPKTAKPKSSVPASKPSSKKSPTDYGEAKRRFVAEPLSKH